MRHAAKTSARIVTELIDYLNLWQAYTYENAKLKKTTVKNNIVRSCIRISLFVTGLKAESLPDIPVLTIVRQTHDQVQSTPAHRLCHE